MVIGGCLETVPYRCTDGSLVDRRVGVNVVLLKLRLTEVAGKLSSLVAVRLAERVVERLDICGILGGGITVLFSACTGTIGQSAHTLMM